MKKLFSVLLSLLLVGVLVIPNLTGCRKKDKEFVFKIGTANGSLCLSPLHTAIDLDLFKQEFEKAGIKYELVEIDLGQVPELIATGKIDGSVGLIGGLIPQIDSGLDVTFVAGLHTGCTKYYTKKGSGIESPKDLKGKKIGVPGAADSSTVALKRILNDLGVNVSPGSKDVEFVVYNLTDLPIALENGAVDAVALHDPVATIAEQEYGFTCFLDTTTHEKFVNEYCCCAFVSSETVKKHPEAAKAYTEAMLKASAYVQAEPLEAARLQIKNNQCSGDETFNAKLLESYNYTPSVSNMTKTFKNSWTELLAIGDLKSKANIDDFIKAHTASFDGVPDSYVYVNGEYKAK